MVKYDSDAENWRAFQRFITWAKTSPLVMVLFGFLVGGPTGSYLKSREKDPQIDSVMVVLKEIKPLAESIPPLQDTVKGYGVRLVNLEDERDRLAYIPPRKREIGRKFER